MTEVLRYLNFAHLRETNVKRCEYGFGHTLRSWSAAEWGNATQGECGEAIEAMMFALATSRQAGIAGNLAKKLLRFRDDVKGNQTGKTFDEYRKELALEIAGMVIYADLWAASLGIDLADAIVKEFNKKSDEIGTKIKL